MAPTVAPTPNACSAPADAHLLTHALGAVAGHGVGDLVPDDDGHAGFVLHDRQDAGVDGDLPARQTECVGLLRLDESKLPLEVRPIDDGGDALSHAAQHGRHFGVAALSLLGEHLLVGVFAELGVLRLGDEHELAPPGSLDGRASRRKGAGDDRHAKPCDARNMAFHDFGPPVLVLWLRQPPNCADLPPECNCDGFATCVGIVLAGPQHGAPLVGTLRHEPGRRPSRRGSARAMGRRPILPAHGAPCAGAVAERRTCHSSLTSGLTAIP
jgi:hypothetical protein